MKKNELLKLAKLTTKEYNNIVQELLEDEWINDDDHDEIFDYIIRETPFLENWLREHFHKVLPDCMKVKNYYNGTYYVEDRYDYEPNYTEYDIERSLEEGKSILNFEIAKEVLGDFYNIYEIVDESKIIDVIIDYVDMCYEIYHHA